MANLSGQPKGVKLYDNIFYFVVIFAQLFFGYFTPKLLVLTQKQCKKTWIALSHLELIFSIILIILSEGYL